MLAVIETGGKQYLISEGHKLKVEKLASKEGDEVVFDKVLLLDDGKSVRVGKPYLDGVTVEGVIIKQGRGKKIRMMRYHSKTRYRKRKGHRQHFTEVQLKTIK